MGGRGDRGVGAGDACVCVRVCASAFSRVSNRNSLCSLQYTTEVIVPCLPSVVLPLAEGWVQQREGPPSHQ